MPRCLCKIIETGSAVLDIKNDKGIYVFEREVLWQGELDKSILDFKEFDSATFGSGGLWANYDPDYMDDNEIETESTFIDIYGTGLRFPDQPYGIEESYLSSSDNNIIGVSLWEREGVFLSNFDGAVLQFLGGKFISGVSRSEKYTYIRSNSDEFICLDNQLDTIWSVKFEKKCFSDSINKLPQFLKKADLVIVNVGEKPKEARGEFELNAYNADNGDLAWQIILEETPCSSNLIGDKVYIIVLRQLIIVDANNGEILVNVKHGFRPFAAATSTYQGMVCPMVNSSNLICISPMDRKVQIRSLDANQVLQTINIPLPYMPSLTVPVEFEGSYYLPLQHIDSFNNGMKGGLLVFEVDLGTNDQVEIEVEAIIAPRPPISVELTQNENGDDVYQVSIEHDVDKPNAASKTLDNLIRFSTIALKETAFKYGSYTSSTEINKNHHGQLLLSVKLGDLKKTAGLSNDELLDKLQIIKERVERNLSDTGVQAGDGSSAFVVDIQIVE